MSGKFWFTFSKYHSGLSATIQRKQIPTSITYFQKFDLIFLLLNVQANWQRSLEHFYYYRNRKCVQILVKTFM